MVKSILFGGMAGQGPNVLSSLLAKALVKQGYYVFYSRDYESLIRGGHNFNVLTFSSKPIHSNESKVDVVVALDERTQNQHKKDLKKDGAILYGDKDNIYFAGALFKFLGLDFELLEQELKELRNFDENLKHAKEGYNQERRNISITAPKIKNPQFSFTNGSQGVCDGAIKSGLDLYYAYPMTPATPVLFELAPKQKANGFLTIELENEISVIKAAMGSAITGAKAMIGTSGGGFDLMTEALSECGMAEIPLVCYLASRPGPGTGVATYTSQGDLQMARHSGHGEFFRMVLAPGDPVECQEIISQAFYFSQKYKIPAIILSDKHLAESFYTMSGKPEMTKSVKTTEMGRYNSYEHTETGEATENSEITRKNFERRIKKMREVEKEAGKFKMFKIHGKKENKNLVLGWGSTKGAILDAIKEIDAKFIQILYVEPFSEKIKQEIGKAKKVIIVENNSTSQLAKVIAEKTGFVIEEKNKILRYDGKPFLCDELREEIGRRLK